jgi:ribosomal-protein-alanine N-acetyltransferase
VWNSYEGKLVAMVRDDDNTESAERPGGYLLLQILTDQQQTLIARLLIDQAARRQGIGTALIGAARAWAAKRGLTSLLAHVPLRNVPGVEFYQRCGFHVCGISEQFYPTREDALLLMRRV